MKIKIATSNTGISCVMSSLLRKKRYYNELLEANKTSMAKQWSIMKYISDKKEPIHIMFKICKQKNTC